MTITGLKEASRALRKLARDFDAKIVAPALVKALEPVERRLIAEAPKATGALAGSVEVTPPTTRDGITRASVIATADYAGHRDLGTSDMKADPYAERAFAATARQAIDIAEREIRKGIERVSG